MELRKLRQAAKLKAVAVAKQLGITQGYYSHIELGRRSIKESLIPELAKILLVSEDDIYMIRDKREKDNTLLKHWIDHVTIGGNKLINEIIQELRFSRRFDIDDIDGFPYFMSEMIADKIREELKMQFKHNIRFREFFKSKLDEIK